MKEGWYTCNSNSTYGMQIKVHLYDFLVLLFIFIKCMCSRCRHDDIHVCFPYASPQRMPHMYDHEIVFSCNCFYLNERIFLFYFTFLNNYRNNVQRHRALCEYGAI